MWNRRIVDGKLEINTDRGGLRLPLDKEEKKKNEEHSKAERSQVLQSYRIGTEATQYDILSLRAILKSIEED